jgi:hypothetical protein
MCITFMKNLDTSGILNWVSDEYIRIMFVPFLKICVFNAFNAHVDDNNKGCIIFTSLKCQRALFG